MEENEQKISKEKLLEDVTRELKELDDLEEMESLIQDNTIEFSYDNQTFRVRKPNRSEKLDIRSMKNKKQNELLKDPANVTEVELIEILLKRPIPVDVPKMRQEVKTLQQKIDNLAIRLTECPFPNDREKIVEQIHSVRYEQVAIQYRISDLLSSCVEKQLKDFVQEYIVYSVLEKKADTGWGKYLKSYELFMNSCSDSDDRLIYRATYYMALLLHNDA